MEEKPQHPHAQATGVGGKGIPSQELPLASSTERDQLDWLENQRPLPRRERFDRFTLGVIVVLCAAALFAGVIWLVLPS